MTSGDKQQRIAAIQHVLASIFASQKALRNLAPEHNWSGLGNLLGDFGELIAIDHYSLTKAPSGASSYDALTHDGKTVQIKTNHAANQIGFRETADLLLVIRVSDDGQWKEPFSYSFPLLNKLQRKPVALADGEVDVFVLVFQRECRR